MPRAALRKPGNDDVALTESADVEQPVDDAHDTAEGEAPATGEVREATEEVVDEDASADTVTGDAVTPDAVTAETVTPETVTPETVTAETVTPDTVTAETVAEEPDTEDAVAPDTVTAAEPTRRSRWKLRRSPATVEPTADPGEGEARDPDVEAQDGEAKVADPDAEVADLDAKVADPDAEAPEPVLVPHRTAGRYLKAAAVVAAGLFVGAAGFAGASLQPLLADHAVVHTKFEVAETAAKAISTLWTYTPDDMSQLPDRAAKYLGGDFASEYRRYIDAIVEPNKQAQISNSTEVLGAAVESLTGDEASAIVYTNSVATSPVTKNAPSLRYLSYRLTMERRGAEWLITKMAALTSLDLTPRL